MFSVYKIKRKKNIPVNDKGFRNLATSKILLLEITVDSEQLPTIKCSLKKVHLRC